MIKIELSNEMLTVIAAALGNHPFRQAAPVVSELQRQIDAQQRANVGSNGTGQSIVMDFAEKKPEATN